MLLVKKEDGILVQAHPFRKGSTVLNTDFLDGLEVNCHPLYKKSYCEELIDLAKQSNLIITCGGDYHADTYRPKYGMLLLDYISNESEFIDYFMKTREYKFCLNEPNGVVCDIKVENYNK